MDPLKILVVDDDASIREVLSIALSVEDGVGEVRQASNGRQAVQTCHEFTPDLVMIDYWMPVMDGGDAAERIRALHPRVHIVAFSGALDSKPPWADSYFIKGELPDLAALVGGARV